MFATVGFESSKWFDGTLSNVMYWAIQCMSELRWLRRIIFARTRKSKLSNTTLISFPDSTFDLITEVRLDPRLSIMLRKFSLVCVMHALFNLSKVEQNSMCIVNNVAMESDPFSCTSDTQQNSIHFLYERQLSAPDIHQNTICCAKRHYLSSIVAFQLWNSHGNHEIQNIWNTLFRFCKDTIPLKFNQRFLMLTRDTKN